MAVVPGGVYGSPRGRAGGLVWGGARSRGGIINTIRAYTVPTDLRSADQLDRRLLFKTATQLANHFGGALWRNAWNRYQSGLSGYDCITKWLIDNLELSADVPRFKSTVASANLGPCYNPGWTLFNRTSTELYVRWTTECKGAHCAANDPAMGFLAARTNPTTYVFLPLWPDLTQRQGFEWYFSHLTPATYYTICLWFEHLEDDARTFTPSRTFTDHVQTLA